MIYVFPAVSCGWGHSLFAMVSGLFSQASASVGQNVNGLCFPSCGWGHSRLAMDGGLFSQASVGENANDSWELIFWSNLGPIPKYFQRLLVVDSRMPFAYFRVAQALLWDVSWEIPGSFRVFLASSVLLVMAQLDEIKVVVCLFFCILKALLLIGFCRRTCEWPIKTGIGMAYSNSYN